MRASASYGGSFPIASAARAGSGVCTKRSVSPRHHDVERPAGELAGIADARDLAAADGLLGLRERRRAGRLHGRLEARQEQRRVGALHAPGADLRLQVALRIGAGEREVGACLAEACEEGVEGAAGRRQVRAGLALDGERARRRARSGSSASSVAIGVADRLPRGSRAIGGRRSPAGERPRARPTLRPRRRWLRRPAACACRTDHDSLSLRHATSRLAAVDVGCHGPTHEGWTMTISAHQIVTYASEPFRGNPAFVVTLDRAARRVGLSPRSARSSIRT